MTSTTKKVVAGVTAAATIATGVFVATYDNATQVDLDKLVPDINSYMPSMPNLDLNVGLNIPNLNTDLNVGLEQSNINQKELIKDSNINVAKETELKIEIQTPFTP